MTEPSTPASEALRRYLDRLRISPLEIVASALAIGLLVGVGDITEGFGAPLLVPSLAASIAILFMAPAVSRGLAWGVVGGQVASGAVGLAAAQLAPAHPSIATVVAVVGALAAMRLLRCVHPPGLATAVIVVLSPDSAELRFLVFPLLAGSLLLVGLAAAVERFEAWRAGRSGDDA